MIKYLFHISDIHIKPGSYVNIEHSFMNLIIQIKKYGVDESLLVIVGDVFESKSYILTDDIFQWKTMCHLLKTECIKTLIIPGNHDYNINSDLVRDNISLLTPNSDYPNIICINNTCVLDGIVFGDKRIEFYIFSPIDKIIPKILENDNIKIALLHESLNCARYDNGELISGARFRAKDLGNFDYVLLGDIHLHQFLTDRIAYSGSFVQKTKGEGIEKGYILWNLDDKVGKFYPLPLKEVFIKLLAENDDCDLPNTTMSQTIRHVSLFYKNCSQKYIDELKNIIVARYGYIHRIINTTKNNIDSSDLNVDNPVLNHEKIIEEIMKDDKRLPNILAHHANALQNRNENIYTTYKLNYLYWSNIFCYGEHNYINFNEFHNNLVMLNGKNREGKSSIIDIIIRALFNECERGVKEDIVNKSKTHGYIKISFNIGSDEYVIEQLYRRTTKTQQHRLYKNGINITLDTIVNTYKYIRTKIGLGDYKDFVNMTTALQNRKLLVDLSQKDFISLLTKITNIDVLEDIAKDTSKEILVLKAMNKKYKIRIDTLADISDEEISDLEYKKKSLIDDRDKKQLIIDDINKKLLELNKDYNNIHIPDNLDDLIKDIKIKQNDGLDYTNLETRIKKLSDITYKPKSKIRDINTLTKIINNYKYEEQYPIEPCKISSIKKLDINDADEELVKCGLPNYNTVSSEIIEVEKKISNYTTQFDKFIFDESCKSCFNNRTMVGSILDIKQEKSKLHKLKTMESERKLREIKYTKACKYKDDKALNDILERNIIAKNKNQTIASNLKKYNKALEEMKELENKQNWDELKSLEKLMEFERLNNLYKIRSSNINKTTDINKLNELIKTTKEDLQATNREITRISEEYQVKKNIYNSKKELVTEYTTNINQLEFLELYNSIINCKTGIPSYVLKQTCKIVENNCNALLREITDFIIEIVYDKDIKIYTIENDVRLSVQLASGMQKFVLDLIFRITLTNISSISSPNTLFVDEGFGTLDTDNFVALASMLQKLKSNFDSLIIISHINELKAYVDVSINIKKKGHTSSVQYGTLTNAEKTVRLLGVEKKESKSS